MLGILVFARSKLNKLRLSALFARLVVIPNIWYIRMYILTLKFYR